MRKTACFTVAGGKCISVNGTDLAISGEVLQLETIAGPWPLAWRELPRPAELWEKGGAEIA